MNINHHFSVELWHYFTFLRFMVSAKTVHTRRAGVNSTPLKSKQSNNSRSGHRIISTIPGNCSRKVNVIQLNTKTSTAGLDLWTIQGCCLSKFKSPSSNCQPPCLFTYVNEVWQPCRGSKVQLSDTILQSNNVVFLVPGCWYAFS